MARLRNIAHRIYPYGVRYPAADPIPCVPSTVPLVDVLGILRTLDAPYHAIVGGAFWNADIIDSTSHDGKRCARVGGTDFRGYGDDDRVAALDLCHNMSKWIVAKIRLAPAAGTPEQWQAMAEAINHAIDRLGPQEAP